jgi:hypothetical protein
MIYIEQGVINQVVLTLTEVTTVSTPHYLFAFTNEMNTTSVPLTIAQTTGVVIEEGRMVVSGPVGTSIYD